MKFCKNLQRVVDISDPEWAPYWTNYKMLKKLIKELPSLVPNEDGSIKQRVSAASREVQRPDSPSSSVDTAQSSAVSFRQQHGDKTTEVQLRTSATETEKNTSSAEGTGKSAEGGSDHTNDMIGKSPGEVAFFKLLHTEFQKATLFFERAQQEFVIREERVREGMKIMKQPNSIMVSDKWTLLGKSLYRLYKDLLLLETFAIMTYCSFSKILKKHDKVTGYNTRCAFMANIVNKANFTNYPVVLEMISRCEQLYGSVSEHIVQEGNEELYEDERLFIGMIHRLNEQCLSTAKSEGAERAERKEKKSDNFRVAALPGTGLQSKAHSTLRSLVEDNDRNILAAQVNESGTGDDTDDCIPAATNDDKKRSTAEKPATTEIYQDQKRPRTT